MFIYTSVFIYVYLYLYLVAQLVKNLPAMRETWVRSLGWENSLEEGLQPTPVFLPGESHGQRSLAGYSARRGKELETPEQPSTSTPCTVPAKIKEQLGSNLSSHHKQL